MDVALVIEAFHFLRPWVLAVVPLIALLWWRIRDHGRAGPAQRDGLAPHLRAAMEVQGAARRRLQPIDGVCASLLCATVGAAGPTWSRAPDPFLAQSAPLVIILEVTASMDAPDVSPTRLERGKQKIRDLLDLRAGARTALVAYSGTAHRVVPLTEDPLIMRPYLEGLTSGVMPTEGNNAGSAMAIATDILAKETTPGAVLFVLDGLSDAETTLLGQNTSTTTGFLAMPPDGQRDRGLDAMPNASVFQLTPDASDIRRIDRALNAAYRRALLDDDTQEWQDRGRWFALPAALLVLIWFRRGWTMQWAASLVVAAICLFPAQARADGFVDFFFTPDQQGRLAYAQKDFGRAAELFADPLWKGYAYFRNARYPEASEILSNIDTPEATFINAIALLRNRQYRDGVRAFERVLELDPDYPGAAHNLEVAQRIVTFVEETQAQSDTGEESGIGADEVVFDNESGRGEETQIEVTDQDGPEILSAEKWMNTVNTQTGDFLRQRFLLEANSEP
ncbi:MAG: VWA domain-containing protein [Pseudomonadota bacterium]